MRENSGRLPCFLSQKAITVHTIFIMGKAHPVVLIGNSIWWCSLHDLIYNNHSVGSVDENTS